MCRLAPLRVQLAVVAEAIAETAEAVGVFRGDAAPEMEDDVAQLVDLAKVGIDPASLFEKFPRRDVFIAGKPGG